MGHNVKRLIEGHKKDLQGADLTGAYLRGADMDYSCLPLCCGSLDMKMDSRQLAQIAYHLVRLMEVSDDVDEMDRKALMSPKFVDFANRFHRAGECGRVYGLGR